MGVKKRVIGNVAPTNRNVVVVNPFGYIVINAFAGCSYSAGINLARLGVFPTVLQKDKDLCMVAPWLLFGFVVDSRGNAV